MIGNPLWVPKKLSPQELETYRNSLECTLLEITHEADELFISTIDTSGNENHPHPNPLIFTTKNAKDTKNGIGENKGSL